MVEAIEAWPPASPRATVLTDELISLADGREVAVAHRRQAGELNPIVSRNSGKPFAAPDEALTEKGYEKRPIRLRGCAS